jgi:hypothetical protein
VIPLVSVIPQQTSVGLHNSTENPIEAFAASSFLAAAPEAPSDEISATV